MDRRLTKGAAMSMRLNPYLSFDGNARQAMEHYRDVLGGELTSNTFGEFGQAGTAIENLIMHSQLETPAGFVLMGSDTPPGMEYQPGNAVTVILSGDDEAELRRYWEGLSAHATINTPLEEQMWGDHYGQCTDQFGVTWQVNISAPAS
jgi:PhnB protein